MTAQLERMERFIEERFGGTPEHLWARSPQDAICRHAASGKWYVLFMEVPGNRLGLAKEDSVWILNLRCDPRMTGSLLLEEGFLPAYHMNKNSWISILLDGTVPDGKIQALLELSYDSVAPKRRGKRRPPADG